MEDLVTRAASLLHESGGRMTTQRRAIMEALDSLGGHPTAEDVCLAARQRDASINPSTVYRTLNWLEEAGLLAQAWFGPERCRRQESPASSLEHHHFICTTCGEVSEFASPATEEIKVSFARQEGAVVERAALTLYGTCWKCQQRGEENPLEEV